MLAKARELYYRTDAPMKFGVGPLFPPAPGSNLFEAKARSLEDEKATRAIDTVFGPVRSAVEGSSPVSQEVGKHLLTILAKGVQLLDYEFRDVFESSMTYDVDLTAD